MGNTDNNNNNNNNIDKNKDNIFKYERLKGQSKQLLIDQQYNYNHNFFFTITLASGCLMIGLNLYALFKNGDTTIGTSIGTSIGNTINNSANK